MKMPKLFETAFNVYDVTGVIGEGGAGTVYSATDAAGTRVAVKCLAKATLTSSTGRRFHNELTFCSSERHPGIVRVLDSGFLSDEDRKYPFYVMPHYDGTLNDALAGASDEFKLELYSQILDAVDALHIFKTWHRDLKPQNILWNARERTVLISDLGCAKFAEELMATIVETDSRERIANYMFAAPEQKVRGADVDARADIFALGLMLNFLFTGDVPQGAGYKNIGDMAPELGYLDSVVDIMIQNNPSARPQTIGHVRGLLSSKRGEFASKQRLDSLRGTVISQTAVDASLITNPLEIVDCDYQSGQLIMKLNRPPPNGWSNFFRGTTYSGSSYLGSEPAAATIGGLEIRVRANEQTAAEILSFYRRHVERVSIRYQQELERVAREATAQKKAELEKQVAAEELRQRILKKIKRA